MSIEEIRSKLNLADVDSFPPENVVKEFSDQIESVTDGMVIGRVEPYEGKIESYTIKGIAALSSLTSEREYDIQKDLGAKGYIYSRFEFFLTAASLPSYKYRILFFEYGIGGYPVKIVLEQSIADSINKYRTSECSYKMTDRSKLEEMINRVISAPKTIEVIQDLINATKIEQSRESLKEASEPDEENPQEG